MSKAVLIPKPLLVELEGDRTKRLPNETGGYLLGQRKDGHIEIVATTRQGPKDQATPWSFDRDDDSHHLTAIARWTADHGKTGLLGDWHSHPVGDATPSGTDRKAWSILCNHAKGPVVGLILGEDPRLRVFRASKRFGVFRITECFLQSEDEDDVVYRPR